MFLRYITLVIFIITIVFPLNSTVFATEYVFTNPTYLDISGTATQSGGVLNSYPISGDDSTSSEQYCIEKSLFFANYTVKEPTDFEPKAWYNDTTELWEPTLSTAKAAEEITCTDSVIIWTSNAGVLWDNIYWDGTFTSGSASGSVSNVKVKARVNPSLNMTISDEEIDLGTLVSGVASTGALFIEIGTNAKSGVSITARSQSGGLTNTSDNSIQINDLVADGLAESYTWESVINVTDDSVSPAFSAENTTGDGLDTAAEVNENSTEYNVYTTNKAESTNLVDDVEFVVSATSGAETPAGDYEDYVTFTVTGNF